MTEKLRCPECDAEHLTTDVRGDYPDNSLRPFLAAGEAFCANCERTISRDGMERARKNAIARQKRNESAKLRYRLYRDLGMTKTPYGWE